MTDGGPEARTLLVERAAKTWTGQLIDLGARNTLLYYRDLRAGTFDLGAPGVDAAALEQLLAGNAVRLSALVPDTDALGDAAKRARTIRRKATENFEERGLRTLFLAWGTATWENPSSAATPAAPVLLCQANLTPRGGAEEDFEVALTDDWEANPTLLHLLAHDYQVTVAAEQLEDAIVSGEKVDPGPAFDLLVSAATTVPKFAITPRTVLGNFSYAKLPMVKDLEAAMASGALAAHDLIAAIAGDELARVTVRGRYADIAADLPDTVVPTDEFLVLDADSSQSFVINSVVAGGDLVIEGPPGTGKSQTIANLIATLSARGKKSLFVAEKRAAIDAVLDRLNHVGLGDLVLDLHEGAGSRKRLAQDLAKGLADAGSIALPDTRATDDILVRRRSALVAHCAALHAIRMPWGVTVYDVAVEVAGIGNNARIDTRLRSPALEAVTNDDARAAGEDVRSFAQLGGFTLDQSGSTWASAFATGAISRPEDVQTALALVQTMSSTTLPNTSGWMQYVADGCGLRTGSQPAEWDALLQLVSGAAAALAFFEPTVFAEPLDPMVEGLAPAQRGAVGRFFARLTNGHYRRALKAARAQARDHGAKPHALHAAAVDAAAVQTRWAATSTNGRPPSVPDRLDEARAALESLKADIAKLETTLGRPGLTTTSADVIAGLLTALLGDQATLNRLPELRRLSDALVARGFGDALAELQRRRLGPDDAVAAVRWAWLMSIYERVAATDPQVGAFDGKALHEIESEFQTSDAQHLRDAVPRIRRDVAERITQLRDQFPAESDVVEHQARLKRKHLPVRDLFQAAPNVLSGLKPCWAMSPLVVAQLLPAQRCFDVVIFDEASQVTPSDAVGALLRADRAVVAGDTKQLPPTSFFATTTSDDDTDDEEDDQIEGASLALTTGLESVLDVLGALLPPPKGTKTLQWHYRSRDERLIAFSNAQPSLYDWTLTTFPGVYGADCVRHVLVDQSNTAGQELSVTNEVERVVELVAEHVQQRPAESLGIIAMGIKHAERISETLRLRRASDRTLDRFLEQGPDALGGKEPVFIKNLERVQGDERDAIILSVGYGKSADGRMQYRFGPINQEGGERRLNVAITRARRRMTVVSSFASADMDPNRLNAEGARMLKRYLEYAESSGASLGNMVMEKPPLNPFEIDVRDQLTAAGIPVVAQYGCSGYWIDYAAEHPTKPGEMVLAIECDGATYHSAQTARDRDRLRQQHLERLGWRFHRIWSFDWFRSRETEVARAKAAYDSAVAAADAGPAAVATASAPIAASTTVRRGPRPRVRSGLPIGDYSMPELVTMVKWIESDTLLRTEEETLTELMRELGFKRRGPRIVEVLTAAIAAADRQ